MRVCFHSILLLVLSVLLFVPVAPVAVKEAETQRAHHKNLMLRRSKTRATQLQRLSKSATSATKNSIPQSYGPQKLGAGLLVKDYNPMIRPGKATAKADIVSVGIKLLRLIDVSDIHQELKVNLLLKIKWKDQRLANIVDEIDSPQRVDSMQLWTPDVSLANAKGVTELLNEGAHLYSDGSIEVIRNALYTADVDVDVHYFPFDVQDMEVWFECPDYDGSQVQFIVDTLHSTTAAKGEEIWRLDSWTVGPETRTSLVSGEQDGFLVGTARVRRLFGMALLMLVAPLYIIANFSFMAFFVYIGDFPTRVGIVSTGFLTLIAFLFVINDNLPKIAYLTWLHKFCGLTMLFELVVLCEVVLVHVLDPKNEAGIEQQMNQFQLQLHRQEFEQDLQLARNGAANLANVFLSDEDFDQYDLVINAGKAFDRVDISRNGQIDSKELTIALQALDQKVRKVVTLEVALEIISKYSFSGDEDLDAMSRAEFITYVLDQHKHAKTTGMVYANIKARRGCCGLTPKHAAALDWWSKRVIPTGYTVMTIIMLIMAGAFRGFGKKNEISFSGF